MCTSCFSGAEATVMQGAAGVIFVKSEATRLYDQLTGLDPDDRRCSAYDANAEFIAGLGLDVGEVLGSRPKPALSGDDD
jgi:hypothetical protein